MVQVAACDVSARHHARVHGLCGFLITLSKTLRYGRVIMLLDRGPRD